jgi:hypothetical protein
MSTDREDRWDDDDRGYRDDDRRPRADLEAARRRVATPAMLLIVFGLIAVFVEIGGLIAAFAAPNVMAEQIKKIIDSQPPGPQKQQMLDDYERDKDSYRLDSPTNIGGTVVGFVLSVLMLVGGIKMKSLSGYGLALTGAICAIIPCVNGCLCCAMPVGIWAVMVLANPDVKAAFRASASSY